MLCQEFGALPSEMEREDWATVSAIMDYRRARRAVELVNGGESGYEELCQRADLTDILLAMARAQGGTDATVEQVAAGLRQQARGDAE